MQNRALALLAMPLITGLLAGCAASQGDYPTLGRRPVERLHGTMPVPPAEPPAPPAPIEPSAELAVQLARLVGQAEAAQGRFAERETRARQLANSASGASLGSERWSLAAIAYAELESARSDAMIALAELDTLYADATVEGGPIEAVSGAREQVIRLVAGQDRVLAELRGR